MELLENELLQSICLVNYIHLMLIFASLINITKRLSV